jgi:hypothetical protein
MARQRGAGGALLKHEIVSNVPIVLDHGCQLKTRMPTHVVTRAGTIDILE